MAVELVVSGDLSGISDEDAKRYAVMWAHGYTHNEIAQELDKNEWIVRQEMRDERVLRYRAEICSHIYEETKDFVAQLAEKGARTIYEILDDESGTPQAKLQAAEMALKYTEKLRLQESQMQRLGQPFSPVQINIQSAELDSALTRHNNDLERA